MFGANKHKLNIRFPAEPSSESNIFITICFKLDRHQSQQFFLKSLTFWEAVPV